MFCRVPGNYAMEQTILKAGASLTRSFPSLEVTETTEENLDGRFSYSVTSVVSSEQSERVRAAFCLGHGFGRIIQQRRFKNRNRLPPLALQWYKSPFA